ncbi:hypothetical protein VPH35_094413 [Triticum aestivum]
MHPSPVCSSQRRPANSSPGGQLSGSLPAELARVEHLRHLDLSGNGLNGTLPAAVLLNATELCMLSELNLSNNALAGWLPAALLRAPGLGVLGLANNYLAGKLPSVGHEDEVFVKMPKRDTEGARGETLMCGPTLS